MKPLKILALVVTIQGAGIALTALFIMGLRHEARKSPTFTHPPIAASSDWKRFADSAGGFTVYFPGRPERTNVMAGFNTASYRQELFYVNPNEQNSFAVGYGDSIRFSEVADPREFLRTTQSVCVSNVMGKVVFEQEEEVGGYPAREFEYVAGGKANYSVRMKIILAHHRVYEIYVVFLTARRYPEERMTFFNSFKIQTATNSFP